MSQSRSDNKESQPFEIFKTVLAEKGIGSAWKWEDAYRVVQDDSRVKCLRGMADKKAAFQEFIKDLRLKEKVDMRERK